MSTGDLDVYEELATDLRHMVNNPELSDVTFVCEDGVRVHGCTMLLAARSSYFKRMFFGGMVESKHSTVELPTVSSPTLIVVIKFLYVGKLLEEDLHPLALSNEDKGTSREASNDISFSSLRFDWNLLAKVVVAARFFILGRLERFIIDKLRTDLPGGGCLTEESLIQVASRFSAIAEYPCLWTGDSEVNPITDICCTLVEILMTHDLSQVTLSHLSEAAVCLYLKGIRRLVGDKTGELLLDEYLRLRQVLIWCAISGRSDPSENLDRTCLPGPEVAIDYIESRGDASVEERSECEFDFSRGRRSFLNRIAKKSLESFLKFVDFTSVHPELLCGVIGPLGIMEPVDLAKVISAQSLRVSRRLRQEMEVRVSNVWHVLVHTDLWRVPTDDDCTFTLTVRRETLSFSVTAIAGLQSHYCEENEWEIVATPQGSVGQQSMANFEFGFIRLDCGEMFFQDSRLSASLLSHDSRSSTVKICDDLRSADIYHEGSAYHWELVHGNQFQWTTPLKVILSIAEDSCTFSYAEDEMTLGLDRQRDELFYPAICFPVCRSDQRSFKPHYDQLTVEIKNLVGFDHMVAHGALEQYY